MLPLLRIPNNLGCLDTFADLCRDTYLHDRRQCHDTVLMASQSWETKQYRSISVMLIAQNPPRNPLPRYFQKFGGVVRQEYKRLASCQGLGHPPKSSPLCVWLFNVR